jgi:hypothetical protein
MRRPRLTSLVVGGALALSLTGIGVAAAVDSESPDEGTVLNKNGHEVDEHAAFGQETAEEARSKHDAEGHGRPEHARGHGPGHGHGHAFGHLSPEDKKAAIKQMKAQRRADKESSDSPDD